MLICPQCKFENPNTNNFCQNCGVSLTHKVCPKCDAYVPLNAQNCQKCGAECGTVWLAIITNETNFVAGELEMDDIKKGGQGNADNENIPTSASSLPSEFSSLPMPENPYFQKRLRVDADGSPKPTDCLTTATASPVGSYLDPQQRYQLLEPLPNFEEISANNQLCVRVLDCQPYQMSLLDAMTNQYQGLVMPSIEAGSFPDLAKAYVALQPYVNQGIPPIHDAWQQANGNIQIILIEDRSDWPYLLDLWRDDSTSSLQMINYFYQMTKLWALLEPLYCRQSLLELRNLRLDEDQALSLQMLYVEKPESISVTPLSANANNPTPTSSKSLTIKALGHIWQNLFKESQRTQFGSLLQLLADLETGNIQTLLELQSRLQAIASEMQPPSVVNNSEVTSVAQDDNTSPTLLQLDELEEDFVSKSDDLATIVLPMQLTNLDHAGLTDVGKQRHHNEDYFGIDTKINKLELPNNRIVEARALYILCDGMGGHAGGEVASTLAVNTVQQYFQTHWLTDELPTEEQIREAIREANQAIFDVNQQDARSGVGRMGTTLVMLLIQNTQAAIAHVGDSRLYRVTRKSGLEQVTVDHEVGQREISRGVEPSIAYARPDAYQLTQALGPRDENFIIPDVQFFEICEDTLFVLASDGLSDNDLLEVNWQTHLLPFLSSGTNLEGGVKQLIDLANNCNGHDNITVVLVRAKVRPNLESSKELISG